MGGNSGGAYIEESVSNLFGKKENGGHVGGGYDTRGHGKGLYAVTRGEGGCH